MFPHNNALTTDSETIEAETQSIVEYEERKKFLQEMEAEALRPWTAYEQYLRAKSIGAALIPNYTIDQEIRNVFETLCLYFTNDERFEQRNIGSDENPQFGSLKKGICLSGNVGCGKTVLMRIFSKNKRQCYDVLSASTFADQFHLNGVKGLIEYYQPKKTLLGTREWFLQSHLGLCIDDLGIEPAMVNYFGNELNVIESIIQKRHANRIPLDQTHFTTNLTGDQIESKYGQRVRSRLREMVNFIVLPGYDRRK